MSTDNPQQPQQPEVVEQAMAAEPAPAPTRRARLRRAVAARRPSRATLRRGAKPAGLVAAGLVAGLLLGLGVGSLAHDGDGRRDAGYSAEDGRGGPGHHGGGPGAPHGDAPERGHDSVDGGSTGTA
ncbi:hypothetical protein DQ237_04365 [Blastococcus sp. TF02-8]|uniref:hypothetical protein n=1 Tax=Blastococcus sp. TF02-8 TaxID=2250574 RepID=UPI000DEB3555|nr:hypothetical protein [Blastococcus sp. TF02-8]RBY96858.1 hypothetical protein DQ237_04365 [Blastococcus sp. TF02-8]